jgi:hypothetical protein
MTGVEKLGAAATVLGLVETVVRMSHAVTDWELRHARPVPVLPAPRPPCPVPVAWPPVAP